VNVSSAESATQKVQIQCTSEEYGGTQFVQCRRCEHRPTGACLYYLQFITALDRGGCVVNPSVNVNLLFIFFSVCGGDVKGGREARMNVSTVE